jgi:DMSO/TMAO reductase YedYZ molybdopterin-dependent catalytic subunit
MKAITQTMIKIFLANKLNSHEFSDIFHPEYYALRVVSSTFTNGGPSVAGVNKIKLLNISSTPPVTPTPTPGAADWPLQLVGAISETMSQAQFQSGVDCHLAVTYTDEDNDTWSGMPLWMLVGQVDDENKHGAGTFNDALAAANYQIKITAADGYPYTFYSTDIARNDDIILANKLNGERLPVNIISGDPPSSHPAYPLKITGPGTSSGSRVGAVVKIELIDLPSNCPAWDLNNDHVCNISDLVVLGLQWGKTGPAGFLPEDLNNDGVINVGDVIALGRYWGKTW